MKRLKEQFARLIVSSVKLLIVLAKGTHLGIAQHLHGLQITADKSRSSDGSIVKAILKLKFECL